MLEEYSDRSETELNKLRDLKNDTKIEKIDVKSILNTGIREFEAALIRSELKAQNVVRNNAKFNNNKKNKN